MQLKTPCWYRSWLFLLVVMYLYVIIHIQKKGGQLLVGYKKSPQGDKPKFMENIFMYLNG